MIQGFFLSYFKNKTCQALLIFTFSLISFLHLIMLLLFSLYQVATNKPLKWAQVITFTFLLNYINYSIIIFVNLDFELSIIWYFISLLQTRSDATLKMDWIFICHGISVFVHTLNIGAHVMYLHLPGVCINRSIFLTRIFLFLCTVLS